MLHAEDNDKLTIWVDKILIIRRLYFDVLTSHSTTDASNSKVVTFPLKIKKLEDNKKFARYYDEYAPQNDNFNLQCLVIFTMGDYHFLRRVKICVKHV